MQAFRYTAIFVFLFFLFCLIMMKDIEGKEHEYPIYYDSLQSLKTEIANTKSKYIKFNSKGGVLNLVPQFVKVFENNRKIPVITERCFSACFDVMLNSQKFYVKKSAQLGYHCTYVPYYGFRLYKCNQTARKYANFSQYDYEHWRKKLKIRGLFMSYLSPLQFETDFNSHKVKKVSPNYYRFTRKW